MKLLYANDVAGRYPDSWYSASSRIKSNPVTDTSADNSSGIACNRKESDNTKDRSYPEISASHHFDVCVIGGGFTGLSTALALAEQGISVCVLEAHQVGWGASGRNGGQLGSGFNRHELLEKNYGLSASQRYWTFCERAKSHVLDLAHKHNIPIDYVPGIVNTLHRPYSVSKLKQEVDAFNETHPGAALQALDKNALQHHVRSDDYFAGVLEETSGHLHPLNLAIGIAQAASNAGASIFENSPVTHIERLLTSSERFKVHTANAQVICNHVVCAMNGYLDSLVKKVRRDVIPINNFMVATEPLGERIKELMPSNAAVADSRFVVNYFRRSADERLLFGGGENYGYRFPKDYPARVKKAMTGVFPSLHDVRIDYAWGGTLGITRSRWPSVQELEPGLYSSSGYSGHGVALANYCGHAVGNAIAGNTDDYNELTRLKTGDIPGNDTVRPWLCAAAMGGAALLDRLPTFGKNND